LDGADSEHVEPLSEIVHVSDVVLVGQLHAEGCRSGPIASISALLQASGDSSETQAVSVQAETSETIAITIAILRATYGGMSSA
jgi:hypothetical protein